MTRREGDRLGWRARGRRAPSRRRREARRLDESFTPEQRDELALIIRSEIADLFYDLFRRRSFWVDR